MKMGVSRSRSRTSVQHLHAGHVGHHQVEQHQVVAAVLDLLQALGAVLGQIDGVAFGGQQHFQAFADIELVVDDQNLAFGVGAARSGGAVISSGIYRLPRGAGQRRGEVPAGTWRRRRAGWRLRSSRHALE